jgi:hypothetical protein
VQTGKRWQPPVWSTKVNMIRPNNRSNSADEENSREKVLSDHILRPMLEQHCRANTRK